MLFFLPVVYTYWLVFFLLFFFLSHFLIAILSFKDWCCFNLIKSKLRIIFDCLFSVHHIISLSLHERVCWRTLGSDDLIICKCFKVIFSLKLKTVQIPLSFSLYFQQKRAPKLPICHFPTKRSVEFLMSQTGQLAFPIFKVIMRQLCIPLTR